MSRCRCLRMSRCRTMNRCRQCRDESLDEREVLRVLQVALVVECIEFCHNLFIFLVQQYCFDVSQRSGSLFSNETAFPASLVAQRESLPCFFKFPAHLFAAFSARRAVNEGKPRLPQSGSRGSHTPTRFARLLILDETDGAPVVPIAAVDGNHTAAIEVQAAGVAGIGRT